MRHPQVFVIVAGCCAVSLMACGLLTSFDGLTGGSDELDARTLDRAAPKTGDAAVAVTTDATTDTSEPFVVYLPAAGKYQYVQNTSAYSDGGDFEASVADFGVDILTLTMGGANKPFRRPQAAMMPAQVDYTDAGVGACWTLEIQVLPSSGSGAHTEDETFCARDGGLLDPGIRSTVQVQTWNLGAILGQQSSTAVVDCSASNVYVLHGMQPGDSFTHACMGTAAQTNGTYLSGGPYDYVGRETTMTADGVTEDVFHTLRTRAVTGATKGQEITDFYLSARDGLPLRIHRHTHIDTPVTIATIDNVLYDEHGSDWILSSHVAQ